jgi:hypothetical protein
MDWEAWARRFEEVRGADEFEALFAAQRTFQDPVTPPTHDVRAVAENTDRIFSNWRQHVDSIRGGDSWAWFEWTGSATFRHAATPSSASIPVVMHGATVVEVDGDGLVIRWRDYLDTNEPIQQIRAGGDVPEPS